MNFLHCNHSAVRSATAVFIFRASYIPPQLGQSLRQHMYLHLTHTHTHTHTHVHVVVAPTDSAGIHSVYIHTIKASDLQHKNLVIHTHRVAGLNNDTDN